MERLVEAFRWLLRIALAVLALLAAAVALGVLNNNVSFSSLSRVDFVKELDRSLAASSDWTLEQFSSNGSGQLTASDLGVAFVSNPPLVHMLVDSATISGDPRLQRLSSEIVAAYREAGLAEKMVDPTASALPRRGRTPEEYQRWISYALSPGASPLSAAELADLLSPDKFRMYGATHQLFALYLYRQLNGDTPELTRVMNRLEGRIAAEAAIDFRVSDLYLQRIAFLLAAGRPDLVKRRWVERALAAQQSDGGWRYTWHGWGPHLFSYTFSDAPSLAHTTAQGMWLTNMLKYRYPQWIAKNYK